MMNEINGKKYVPALIVGLMLSFSFASYASDEFVPSVKVQYASIDVNHPEGQKLLYRKLKQASHQVCGSINIKEAGSAFRVAQNRLCAKRALSRAVKQVGIDSVSEMHVSQR